jgi:rRNA maturation RNase YbeY
MIGYNSDDIKIPLFPRRKITRWIKQIIGIHGKRAGDISYVFCSDSKILVINKDFLNHDYYTDIITFDYVEDDIISGEIYISVDTVRTNAEAYNVSFENELFRVIIHGILHLCGLEDKDPDARMIMEQHENEALEILQYSFNLMK